MTNRHHHGDAPTPADRSERRVHHSPLFWFGAAMFLTAISIYLWSEDLSWRPRIEAR